MSSTRRTRIAALLVVALLPAVPSRAQPPAEPPRAPTMVAPTLAVRSAIAGLNQPMAMAFLGASDLLVLEKATGRVLRVTDGKVVGTAIDLAVNSADERGLLGIALHPKFPQTPHVYLSWSCRTASAPADSSQPDVRECTGPPELGEDSHDVLRVPLLGNRVDRFVWDGQALTFDRTLLTLRSFMNDAAPNPPGQNDQHQPVAANHTSGVLRFGPDGKLYVIVGDLGRRSQLQNLPSGPTETGLGTPVPDDQFGGPDIDPAHFSGVIVRLNDDGSVPDDNPFFAAGAQMGGDAGPLVQRIYAYGLRNSFGLAFDPKSGHLWEQDNGEDAYDELNRIVPGMNGGWVQVMGPIARVPDYRAVEDTSLHNETVQNLQQYRWPQTRIARTAAEARARLFVLPGSRYVDPEFSWRHVVAPAAIGFIAGNGLGASLDGDLVVGMSVPQPNGGSLLRFDLAANRQRLLLPGARLRDRVDDNRSYWTFTESAPMLFGRDFGVVTDIQTGPNGNLYVMSFSRGEIFEVHRRTPGAGARSTR